MDYATIKNLFIVQQRLMQALNENNHVNREHLHQALIAMAQVIEDNELGDKFDDIMEELMQDQ